MDSTKYLKFCYILVLFTKLIIARSVRETTNKVFSAPRDELLWNPEGLLTFLWTHEIPSSSIRWCNWQYRPLQDNKPWQKFIGYDKEHSKLLNITAKYSKYHFIDESQPCENGIWSSSEDKNKAMGEYRMMVIALNGTPYSSPAVKVVSQQECSPPDAYPTIIYEESSTSCTGPWVFVVILILLMITATVLFVLYWKKKLPGQCYRKLNCLKKRSDQLKDTEPKSQISNASDAENAPDAENRSNDKIDDEKGLDMEDHHQKLTEQSTLLEVTGGTAQEESSNVTHDPETVKRIQDLCNKHKTKDLKDLVIKMDDDHRAEIKRIEEENKADRVELEDLREKHNSAKPDDVSKKKSKKPFKKSKK